MLLDVLVLEPTLELTDPNPRQSGTNEDEEINGVAAGSDGYVVLCGYTRGNWSGSNDGNWDLAAVKLNEDGQELWRLQVMKRACGWRKLQVVPNA